jgi:hypothetical protein
MPQATVGIRDRPEMPVARIAGISWTMPRMPEKGCRTVKPDSAESSPGMADSTHGPMAHASIGQV